MGCKAAGHAEVGALAIAATQQSQGAFDKRCAPAGSAAIVLFRLKQRCTHATLTKVLKAGTSLELIRAHQGGKGAQAALKPLSKGAEKPAMVPLTSGDALTCMASLLHRLAMVGGEAAPRQVLAQRWSDQLRQRAVLAPHTNPLPDNMKLVLLQSAVELLLELRPARNCATQLELAGGCRRATSADHP